MLEKILFTGVILSGHVLMYCFATTITGSSLVGGPLGVVCIINMLLLIGVALAIKMNCLNLKKNRETLGKNELCEAELKNFLVSLFKLQLSMLVFALSFGNTAWLLAISSISTYILLQDLRKFIMNTDIHKLLFKKPLQ